MTRLFTAIELSAAVRDAVAAEQAQLQAVLRVAGDRNLRPVSAAHLHLTLVFIGEIADAGVPAIVDALSQAIPMPSFEVELRGWGMFPPRGAPRVLWCGVGRGARELTALHEEIAGRLERVGVMREPRAYHPHLTIGRWRDGASPRLRGALPPPVRVATEQVHAVTLFRSVLGAGGPEHTPLARAPLAAAAGPN